MLDKFHEQIYEMIERMKNSSNSNSNSNDNIGPVEFKIWERDNDGNLVSRPVRTVQYMDSNSNTNSNVNPNNKNEKEPIITELGSRNSSKAGSSVSNRSNNDNKVKVIHDFIMSNGTLV